MEINELLVKIAQELEKLRILYCVTGGYAVSIWGRPRFTADLDIVIQLELHDIATLARALRLLSQVGYVDEAVMKDALRHNGEFNFIHPESGLKVDFWVVGSNPVSGQEIKRAIVKKLYGQNISFISPEDLILSKLRWYQDSASTRQLEDIESVIKISKIDEVYLKNEARKQGTIEILNSLK